MPYIKNGSFIHLLSPAATMTHSTKWLQHEWC